MSDYQQGFQDCYSEIVKSGDYIPKSVLEDIKADILSYKDDKIIHTEQNEMIDIMLEIIDRHLGSEVQDAR